MNKIIKITLLIAVAIMLVVFAFVGFMATMMGSRVDKSIEKGKYFYDFDEVVYYRAQPKYPNTYDISNKVSKTTIDSMTFNIMRRETPENISDVRAITYLDSIEFEKMVIPGTKLDSLRDIFRENKHCEPVYTTCAPTYRDIYLLKKRGKIAGVIKLCYECGDMRFIGTDADVTGFGCNGEFGRLRNIVNGFE